MRRLTVLIASAGLSLLAVGCGDDGTGSSATTVAPETTAVATTASAAALEDMLLGVADVGEGWRLSNPINDEDLASLGQVPCQDVALNPTLAGRLVADTGVQFEPIDGSYKHIIELAITGEPDQLSSDLQALYDATISCGEIATSGLAKVEELTVPDLGDQAYGVTLVGTESNDATWYVRSAVVREGSVAVSIGVTEILPDPSATPTITDEQVVKLLESAVTRMEGTTT